MAELKGAFKILYSDVSQTSVETLALNAESGSHSQDLDSNLAFNEAQESAFNKHPYDSY